jgi:hypothetical protein
MMYRMNIIKIRRKALLNGLSNVNNLIKINRRKNASNQKVSNK